MADMPAFGTSRPFCTETDGLKRANERFSSYHVIGWVRCISGMVNSLVLCNAYAALYVEMFNVYCMVFLKANIAADDQGSLHYTR